MFKRSLLVGTLGAVVLPTHAETCPVSERSADSIDSSRIAVAGGSLAETIFLLGAEDRIIAADRTSNYPAAARDLPSIGYVRALSAEGVLSLNPTLVIGEHDMGPPEVVAQLEQTRVPVLRYPEQFEVDGVLEKVRCVGELLEIPAAEVEQASSALRAQAARLESVQPNKKLRVALLLGLREGAPVAAGRETSGDGLLTMAGVQNLFADFEGWKPVSLEAMAQAGPDLIVIPERGLEMAGGAEALFNHPALRLTPAAKTQNVVAMDGMKMLGFGPRTLGAAIELAEHLGTLPAEPSRR